MNSNIVEREELYVSLLPSSVPPVRLITARRMVSREASKQPELEKKLVKKGLRE